MCFWTKSWITLQKTPETKYNFHICGSSRLWVSLDRCATIMLINLELIWPAHKQENNIFSVGWKSELGIKTSLVGGLLILKMKIPLGTYLLGSWEGGICFKYVFFITLGLCSSPLKSLCFNPYHFGSFCNMNEKWMLQNSQK